MKISKKTAKKQEIFDSLVHNAIDFLEHSISEFEESPKFSIINFCTAVELFLKARLMYEHWTLIYEDPKDAKFDSFLQGDFKSVSIESSIKRLKYVVDLKITKEEENSFNKIRNHRNQLVHFFNDSYIDKSKEAEIEAIAQEECKGWFYLSQILKQRWKDEFSNYISEVERLDRLMSGIRVFLKAKYEALLPQLELEQKRGVVFYPCFVCNCLSLDIAVNTEILKPDRYLSTASSCRVCNSRSWDKNLKFSCSNCNDGLVTIYDLGEGECENCHHAVDLNYLLEKYSKPEYNGSGEFHMNRAYCDFCEETEQPTVVPFGDVWLCLSCLEIHDNVGSCGYCNETVTGDLEDSFLLGCLLCEGQMSHYMNSSAYAD